MEGKGQNSSLLCEEGCKQAFVTPNLVPRATTTLSSHRSHTPLREEERKETAIFFKEPKIVIDFAIFVCIS
jgi:hypothetical protein